MPAVLKASGAALVAVFAFGCAVKASVELQVSHSDLTPEEQKALGELSPRKWPAAPPDSSNRFADNADAAAFGQTIFGDGFMSGTLLDSDNDGTGGSLGMVGDTGKVACASCHVPASGFSDSRSFQRQISLGAGWGRRRAPSLLDVGQAKLLMWDGRRDALYNQPFGVIESVVEMHSSRLYAAEQVFAKYRDPYEALFGPMPPLDDASQFPPLTAQTTGCEPKYPTAPEPTCDGPFHGSPGDGAEFDGMTPDNQDAVTRVIVNVAKALAAYERTLTCGQGPFDAWVRGDDTAISDTAQQGAKLFIGKAGCSSCHSGPFLSDQQFHNVGLSPEKVQQLFVDSNDRGAIVGLANDIADPLNTHGSFSDGDDGRLPSDVTSEMEGAFRTPMLRCVGLRPSFMHTGQMYTLADVVDFFDQGGDRSGFPGTTELHLLNLTDDEKSELVEFLGTLTGDAYSH